MQIHKIPNQSQICHRLQLHFQLVTLFVQQPRPRPPPPPDIDVFISSYFRIRNEILGLGRRVLRQIKRKTFIDERLTQILIFVMLGI